MINVVLTLIYCVTDFMAKLNLTLIYLTVVGGRYFVVGDKIVGGQHILTGLCHCALSVLQSISLAYFICQFTCI